MVVGNSFHVDAIANHPKFELVELAFPARLELPHPGAILGRVWHVNDQSCQVVAVDGPLVKPMADDARRFEANAVKMIHNLKDRVAQDAFGDFARRHGKGGLSWIDCGRRPWWAAGRYDRPVVCGA